MRIIGGKYKGFRIKTRKGSSTRPLMARVKKSFFSIIMHELEGARFLDLFAGSGVVGLEALSRGAASCVFVDQNSRCINIIKDNVRQLGLKESVRVIKKRVSTAVNMLESEKEHFDIIFIDAPYDTPLTRETVEFIGESSIMHEGTLVIAKVRKDTDMPDHAGALSLHRTQTYGDTALLFYRV